MELKRVVITGLGAITPLGKDVQSYWDNLVKGVSGANLITRFDASEFKAKFACEVKDYNPTDYFDRKEARKLDLYSQFAIIAANEAIANADLDNDAIDKDEVGVIWGSGIGGIDTFREAMESYYLGGQVPKFNPFFIPKLILDIAAGHISILHGFRGPNFATVSACATSTHALADAYNHIRLGTAKAIVAGGSEASVNLSGVGGFGAMRAISFRNDDPKTGSRPFDADRDGFVIGEGGGALILEELEHAKARGANILAEVAGVGLSADAHHLTAPHPEGEGAALAMRRALKDAGFQPQDLQYINVHGTSTPLGDVAELKAIASVFGDHAFKLSISSNKSMIGHLLGAAGSVEAIATILTIQNNIIPPTINIFNRDPEIDERFDLTEGQAKKREVNAALSNNFGFGGHNASIIFKKYQD